MDICFLTFSHFKQYCYKYGAFEGRFLQGMYLNVELLICRTCVLSLLDIARLLSKVVTVYLIASRA